MEPSIERRLVLTVAVLCFVATNSVLADKARVVPECSEPLPTTGRFSQIDNEPKRPKLVTDFGTVGGTTFLGFDLTCFSSDSSLLLTVGTDNFVRLWDLKTRAEIRSILLAKNIAEVKNMPLGWRQDIDISPDRRVISVVGDEKLFLLDSVTGKELKPFLLPSSWKVLSAHFSAVRPSILLTVSEGKQQFLVEQKTSGSNRILMRQYEEFVQFLNNRYLLVIKKEIKKDRREPAIWDSLTGKEGRSLPLKLDPEAQQTYELSVDHLAPDKLRQTSVPLRNIVGISPDAKVLYLLTKTGLARITPELGRPPKIILPNPGEHGYWEAAALSPDGSQLAASNFGETAAYGGSVAIIDANSGALLHKADIGAGYPLDIKFSPDGRFIAAAFRGGTWVLDKNEGWNSREKGRTFDLTETVKVASDSVHLLINETLWDLSSGRIIGDFDLNPIEEEYRSVTYRPNEEVTETQVNAASGHLIAIGVEQGDRYGILLYDTNDRKYHRVFPSGLDSPIWIAFSSDSHFLSFRDKSTVFLWDTANDRLLFSSSCIDAAFNFEGDHFVIASEVGATVYSLYPSMQREAYLAGRAQRVVFLAGKLNVLLVSDQDATIWDWKTGSRVQSLKWRPEDGKSRLISSNGRTLITTSGSGDCVWDISRAEKKQCFEEKQVLTVSPQGGYVVLKHRQGLQLYDVDRSLVGPIIDLEDTFIDYDTPWAWMKIAFFSQDEWMAVGSGLSVHFVNVKSGRESMQLISQSESNWITIDPEGRFDTVNLEFPTHLFWMMPDDSFHPLPLEILMRQYYEPQLMQHILSGKGLLSIPPMKSLNRLQPEIRITKITPQANSEEVSVQIEMTDAGSTTRPSDGKILSRSGIYDLRLFRNGQLVAQYPSNESDSTTNSVSPSEELVAWRRAHKINTDARGRYTHIFSNVRLPQRAGMDQVEFTAYAFNEDRVKSATSEPVIYRLPQPRSGTHPRAYLITVGVDVTSAGWRLGFARKGVREVEGLLKEKLGSQYEVVPVQLISAYKENSTELVDLGTKGNLHTVLNVLSGENVAMADRQKIPKQEQLRIATPDDLVVLYIASHGYVDPGGKFYVIPSDIGQPLGVSEELLDRCLKSSEQSPICETGRKLLQHSISGDELTQWIEAIDAEQVVLVLDSCHSGAVSGPGFKPGPMGDRSFGQLSYDKGMLVLAATQEEQFDVGNLELGNRSLLTYALTQQPLAGAPFDLRQWLSQAEKQVPELYKRFVGSGRPPTPGHEQDQQPALFDFSRKKARLAATP